MKNTTLYNVIFPIWFLLFFPPVIFVTLIGNFIIDSIVVMGCFYVFKPAAEQMDLKGFYKASIFKVWVFGFLADIAGAFILFLVGILDPLGLPYEVISGINFDPFENPLSVIIIVFAMLVSSALILKLNYKFTFRELISDAKLRLKVAAAIAIVTIPWTFLLPTKWFYRGF